ncbi:MAG: HpcH/HpaI aldolase/citrate lyase family protein [Deltaproteobacteria bacterium]|nr:HpcH/HpaI aldolase/citrate lyase family protein [Deltaproteobacteria bacterium]
MERMKFVQLGASLYVPATRADLLEIAVGAKLPGLRSWIFCTEDSVKACDVDLALANVERALRALRRDAHFEPGRPLRYVRARSVRVARRVLEMSGADQLDGIVIPKATQENVEAYLELIPRDLRLEVMLTLETSDAFDRTRMRRFAELLLQDRIRDRIASLRIGGNDLLNLLSLRRPRDRTIYETPVGRTISDLVTLFRPLGFNLTGPVYEHFDDMARLRQEVDLDLSHGLFGKSAIHPRQVSVIEERYRVDREELEAAERILDDRAPATFALHGSMCEPATHHRWAQLILARKAVYGIR